MYKDILVHLDGGDRDEVRIRSALSIALRNQGRLTGLFARSERHGPAVVARRASDSFEQDAQKSQTQFEAATAQAGVQARWWRLAHGETGHVLHEMVAAARFHDLTVLGQHHEGKDAPEELVEHVILQSGRPALILPSVDTYQTVGTNVIIAWNGGREATRALHDCIPLIDKNAVVEIVTVRPQQPRQDGVALPPLSIHDHLAQHGIAITREVLAGEDIGVMDLLLSRAFDQGADLLVMGAHGGYHLPFFKGSGTRHILHHMTLPVLMAN